MEAIFKFQTPRILCLRRPFGIVKSACLWPEDVHSSFLHSASLASFIAGLNAAANRVAIALLEIIHWHHDTVALNTSLTSENC